MHQNKNLVQDKFFLTTHAKTRLKERLQAKPHKHLKIAKKAWYSKPPDRHEIVKKLEYQKQFRRDGQILHYRQLMGYIFVFVVENKIKKLITLYK